MEHFAKLADFTNLGFAGAYWVRGLHWLRTLALTGVASLALYFYSLPQPLVAAVYWHLFYTVLNARWIGWLTRRWRTAEA